MEKYKTKMELNKILKGSKGITLIALVITIIVLLILAAISIATLTGENGILTKAQKANDRTKEATVKEQIEVEAMGSFDDNGKFNKETFKQRIQDIGGKVLSDDGNEIKVELDGYEAVVDAKTGKIKSLVLSGTEPGGGEEVDGTELTVKATVGKVQNSKVTITIEVTNEVEKVNSITVTNTDSGKTYTATISGKGGTVEVDSNGTYKIEVEATIDGSQKTGETTAKVEGIEVAFTKEFGKIDIIWVDTDANNTKRDTPLPPVLNENNKMKKVYWEDGGTEKKEEEEGFEDSKWYNYVAGDNDTDSKDSHWANAINTTEGEGDSYFVWIPRFAYKITYLTAGGQVAGYCDGDGIKDANGNIQNSENAKTGIETVEYNGYKYIVHPAFVDNVNNGGWTSDLPGIWVAKYEMSAEDSSGYNISTSSSSIGNVDITKNYSGNIARMVSKPGVTSWRNITIGNIYTNAMAYDRSKESHLMKNSEWGAVAYLTHSQYGRNGHEITINGDSSYYTGGGQNDDYKTKNTDQSSTGNVYGIYDLSGGAWEFVAAFNDKDSNSYETRYGNSFVGTSKNSDEYATKYSSSSSTPSYNSYYPGDATYEVYSGSDSQAWINDSSTFVYSDYPFFVRGGYFDSADKAGVLCTSSNVGNVYVGLSFRVVLADV